MIDPNVHVQACMDRDVLISELAVERARVRELEAALEESLSGRCPAGWVTVNEAEWRKIMAKLREVITS